MVYMGMGNYNPIYFLDPLPDFIKQWLWERIFRIIIKSAIQGESNIQKYSRAHMGQFDATPPYLMCPSVDNQLHGIAL